VFAALCVCAVAQETPRRCLARICRPGRGVDERPGTRGVRHAVILETQAGVVRSSRSGDDRGGPSGPEAGSANVAWVPGYWAWDAARVDYIWVRAAGESPAGCTGYRVLDPHSRRMGRVAGFWKVTEQTQEIEYLTAPPRPSKSAPAGTEPDVVWCQDAGTGTRTIRQRHGYWLPPHTGWSGSRRTIPGVRTATSSAGDTGHEHGRRGVLFTPLLPAGRGRASGVRFLAVPVRGPGGAEDQPVHLSALQSLLFRRLLR